MDRLRMLSEIVESGKSPRAVTLEGTLAGVLPNVASQMFAPGEAQVTRREVGAEEALAFLLLGGRCVASHILVVVGILHRFVRHGGRPDMGDGCAG
jgi:hypothetical protein